VKESGGMKWASIVLRLRALLARGSMEREMNEEIRFHVEMEAGQRS
jgi:hypothetical protein